MKIGKFVPFAAAVGLGASLITARAQTATTTVPTETVSTTTVPTATAPTATAHVWEDPNAWWGTHFVYSTADVPKFTAQELSLDLFASFTSDESKFSHVFQHSIRDGTWGGGVGLNYFITRELGIGGDLNMKADGGNFVDAMAGNLIARFPIESAGIAPYVFGGGTRLTEPRWQWAGQFGVGLEVRFNPLTGIFADVRYMWPEHTTDELEIRTGLRLVF